MQDSSAERLRFKSGEHYRPPPKSPEIWASVLRRGCANLRSSEVFTPTAAPVIADDHLASEG